MDFNLTIYFVRNPNNGEVKIGKTNNFENRYKSLCSDAKCKLEVLLLVEGDDTERMLHRYFEEEHTKGEWFYFSDKLKTMIDVSKKKGRLVYPEGEPKRTDLLVDYRLDAKKAKELEKKVSTLERQSQKARESRDKYKSLAGSAGYYKDKIETIKKNKEVREYRLMQVGWLSSLLYGFFFVVQVKTSLFGYKLHLLIDAILATLFWYGFMSYVLGIKKKWVYLFYWFFGILALLSWVAVFLVYFKGD